MMSQLRHFTLASFKFYLAFPEGASLPPYLGSTLRGSFGVAFKKVVCTLKDTACDQCLLKNRCVYSYIFPGVNSYFNSPLSVRLLITCPILSLPLLPSASRA